MPKPSESSTKFIERNRAPRVHIEYELDVNGAQKKVELPFIMGVMSDLSGKIDPDKPLPPIKDRKFLEIDMDNFDDRMKAIKPRVAFPVKNVLEGTQIEVSHEAVANLQEKAFVNGMHKSKVGETEVMVEVENGSKGVNGPKNYTLHDSNVFVDISFESMDDFSPEVIARKVEPLRKLLEARTELTNLLSFMDGKTKAEDLINDLLNNDSLMKSILSSRKPADAAEGEA
jgi:type VI secretion system protein ImpB